MKINVVVPSFYPATVYGGPIFSIYGECRVLAEKGVDMHVSTTNAGGRVKLQVQRNKPVLLSERLMVTYYDDLVIGRFSLRFLIGIWRDVLQCDVVHIQDIFSTYIPPALLAARFFGKPVLVSPRGVLSPWALRSRRFFLKRLWLKLLFDPFVRGAWWHATSESERKEVLARYPDARVVVIPNGVDAPANEFVERLSRREYLRRFAGAHLEADRLIVSLGRLHRVKGFDILLRAFAHVREHAPNVALLIAGGDDGEKSRLQSMIQELGLQENAFLVGHLEGKDRSLFLANADLFILCSHSENFGNVIVEAMAAGVPVVASTGTPWRSVEERGAGRWVAPEPAALCAAILDLLARDAADLGARARAHAADFDWGKIGDIHISTYRSMLDQRARTSRSNS